MTDDVDTGFRPPQHPLLEALEEQPTQVFRVPNSAADIKAFIRKHVSKRAGEEPCIYAKLMPFQVPKEYQPYLHNPVYIGIALSTVAIAAGGAIALLRRR